MSNGIMLAIAYFLDFIFGDPPRFPHPVKAMGWMITTCEKFLRKNFKNEKIAGALLTFLVVGIVWCVSLGFFLLVGKDSLCGMMGSIFFIYTCLSVKDLRVQSMRVYDALKKDDLKSARDNLSMIVGRDTKNLNREDVIRATVETVAENMVDGIISPMFYAFIGGAPLALAYKAVNTLDSMVGYKNEKYKDFGFVSAKLDDIVNFIPARLTIILFPLASIFMGGNGYHVFKVILRDRKKHASPNSGIPEAGMAGALNVQLGGLSHYKGIPSNKFLIGDALNALDLHHIKDSLIMNNICSLFFLLLGIFMNV